MHDCKAAVKGVYTLIMKDTDLLKDIGSRCLGVRTLSAARAVTRHYDTALRPCGLTITQFTLLVTVAGLRPQSITDLAQDLSIERTALSRNLSLLESEGWLARSSEGPARKRSLTITTAGRRKLRQAYPLWQQAQAELENNLGENLPAADAILTDLRGREFNGDNTTT